ncbi:MAG: CocE/NonD family hydrolase, partial [Chloroflexota bacterium]|nr:CocE/NonD family hydrolase [Chloroflexota bacterium]
MPEEVICDSNVEVPMRDGVCLECDVVRPRPPGKYPVLVVRSPYGREAYVDDPGHSVWFFAQRGYAVVTQDCRARFGSEGERYDPLFQEVEDGYDTVEWAARQSWSNGRVGTTGQSYMGATQYTLATNNPLPPHLQTMAPVSASSDFHQSWVYHTGGAMEWGWMVPYAIHKGINTLERMGRTDLVKEVEGYLEPGENFARPLTGDWYRHLPLNDWAELLKETAPYFGDYLANESDGPYWWRVNLNRHLAGISVPMLHVSSWYDIFLEGALNAFVGISEKGANQLARENQKLLVGPWAHLLPYNKPTSGDTGEIDFGEEARIELHDYLLRWFDHWLKDVDTGIMDESPVRLFI